MIKVNIRCPACGKNGYIAVEENLLKNSERGVTAVNIGKCRLDCAGVGI